MEKNMENHMGIISWVLPPLSNSWIIFIISFYIAFNRTLSIDCYWVGAVPKLYQGIRQLLAGRKHVSDIISCNYNPHSSSAGL